MFKKALNTACVYFTVLVALYSLINLALYSADTDSFLALSSLRVFCFFPFSLLLALAGGILRAKELDGFLRYVLHYMVTMVGAFLFLILPMGQMKASSTLVGLLLFSLVYAAVTVAAGLITASAKKRQNREQDYTPVYRKPNNK